MLTIFTIPKPFEGESARLQRNALENWRQLGPQVDLLVFGNDPGVAEAAFEVHAHHQPTIACNTLGTPLVSDAFHQAQTFSRQPFLMYANADMLFSGDLMQAIEAVRKLPAFLLSGRRWDIDVDVDLTSARQTDWRDLFASRRERGKLHGPAGMDYFVFPRELQFAMPEFAVGRVGWDAWLIWKFRRERIPVIDATSDVPAVHQNHGYNSLRLGYQHWRGPERDLNIRAAGGLSHLLTLREASHVLRSGRIERPAGWNAVAARLATFPPYLRALAAKRWIQQKLN